MRQLLHTLADLVEDHAIRDRQDAQPDELGDGHRLRAWHWVNRQADASSILKAKRYPAHRTLLGRIGVPFSKLRVVEPQSRHRQNRIAVFSSLSTASQR
jgi:hypothetical protein